MLPIARKAIQILNPDQKRRLVGVFGVMVVAAFLEAGGVGSLFPFLNIITDPAAIHENAALSWIWTTFGFTDTTSFFIFIGSLVFVLIILAQAASAFSVWKQLNFSRSVQHEVSVRLFERYMTSPYPYFLNRNSSEMHKNVLEEVDRIVVGIFRPGLAMVSQTMLSLAILAILLWTDPIVTFVLLGVVGGSYVLVYKRIHRELRRIGQERNRANETRYRVTSEGFSGIKDLKALGKERFFVDRYREPSETYIRNQVKLSITQQLPHYLIRALTFGGLMGILLILLAAGATVTTIVPLMGLFAFAGYRLMPAFKEILRAAAEFKFQEDLLNDLHADLSDPQIGPRPGVETDPEPLPFQEGLSAQEIVYRYPGSDTEVLKAVSFKIPKNASVAFVGETGAGKTTIVDILMGLLLPGKGQLLVDGQPVTERNVERWKKNIGYVPQEIFLTDDTIRRNIAFGIPDDEIDDEQVIQAAKTAQIHEFITRDLPEAYDTEVGERGVRLSGGQRQRIGIARALYPDPPVLVLDEATSDIDTVTEGQITRAVEALTGTKTLIIVAHRLSTIRNCDQLILIDGGRVLAQGTYEDLSASNPKFRTMVQEIAHPQNP